MSSGIVQVYRPLENHLLSTQKGPSKSIDSPSRVTDKWVIEKFWGGYIIFLKKYPSLIPMDTRGNKFAWIKDYDNDEIKIRQVNCRLTKMTIVKIRDLIDLTPTNMISVLQEILQHR